jgi:hypothetical protein
MSNPDLPNAKVPNVTVPNLNMSTHHGAECTTEPNYNVPKCQGVDVKNCRTKIDTLTVLHFIHGQSDVSVL